MENIGIRKMVEELKKLNPTIHIQSEGENLILAACSNLATLKLPAGYYQNDKNSLTNKHNTASGQYESFELMTMYECLASLA